MTYAEFFEKIRDKYMNVDVSDIKEHLAYQFNIIGEAEGIYYVEVKEGKLYVEPYEYFDRDVIFIASADTFMKIAEGKLDPILAVTLQKMRFEGNIDKALRLNEKYTKDSAETQEMLGSVMYAINPNGLFNNFFTSHNEKKPNDYDVVSLVNHIASGDIDTYLKSEERKENFG